jgi:hypothetical protein
MTIAHRHFGVATAASLIAASTFTAASAQSIPFDPADTVRIGEGYAYSSSDAFGRCEVGQLTDDLRLDVVYGKATEGGNHLYFASGPGVYDSVFQINPEEDAVLCKDFCILPGGGTDGPDGIVVMGTGDLKIWAWDESAEGFTSTTISGTSSTWANLQRIRVGYFDDDSTPDLVGLASGGSVLKVIYDLTPQTSNPSTTTLSWTGSGTIFDFVFANWDGTPQDQEIAVISSTGLKIIDLVSGAASVAFSAGSGASAGDLVIPIDYPSTTRDRVAVLTKAFPGPEPEDWLWLLFVATNPTSGSASMIYCTTLGQIPLVGGAAANVDGDAGNRPELILSQCSEETASTNDELLLLKHLDVAAESASATYSFGGSNYLILDAGNPSTDPHTSWPCAGDADNDGDNDIVYAIEDSDGPFVALMPSRFINKATHTPSISDGTWRGEEGNFSTTLTVVAPTYALPGSNQQLQVTVWLHNDHPTEAPAQLLPSDDPLAVQQFLVDPPSFPYSLSVNGLQAVPSLYEVNTVVIREVEMSGSTIVAVGPDYVGCIGEETYWLGKVDLQFGGGDTVSLSWNGVGNQNVLLGVLPLGRVPHFTNGVFVKDKPQAP